MAFIYRNQLLPAVMAWNGFSSIYQRFHAVWDHNEEVYSQKLYYYRAKEFITDEKLKRFAKGLGVVWAEFLEQEIESEIDDIWFYIEPTYPWDGSHAGDSNVSPSTAETTQLVAPSKQEIADLFNETFEVGEEITLTVNYGGASKRYIDKHKLTWEIKESGVIGSSAFNGSEIREALESDPWNYLANSSHKHYDKDSDRFQLYDGADYVMPKNEPRSPSSRILGTTRVSCVAEGGDEPNKAFGIFAFMPSGGAFEKVGDPYDDTYLTTGTQAYDGEALNFSYSQKFVYKGMVADNPLTDDIVSWFEQWERPTIKHRPVWREVGHYRDDLKFNTRDTSYKKALNAMAMYWDPVTQTGTRNVTNSLFLNGDLRVEPARLMRRRHFVEMLTTSLETDYEVEEASTFEKVLAVVIIVAAIVVGVMTGGAAFAAGNLLWSALATGLGAASMVLSVGMYALSLVGGLSAQGLVKLIGAFAQITGYLSLAAGIMAAVQNAGKLLAEQTLKEAGKEVTEEAIKNEMLQQTLTDQLGALLEQSLDSVKSRLTEFVNLDSGDFASTIMDGLDTFNQGMSFYQDKEMESLNAEMMELDEQQEAMELETLSNQLKNPAAIYQLMGDDIHTPDMLSKLDREIQGKIGQDKKFSMWNSNVNSV